MVGIEEAVEPQSMSRPEFEDMFGAGEVFEFRLVLEWSVAGRIRQSRGDASEVLGFAAPRQLEEFDYRARKTSFWRPLGDC